MRKNNKEGLKVKLITLTSVIVIFVGWVYLVWIQ